MNIQSDFPAPVAIRTNTSLPWREGRKCCLKLSKAKIIKTKNVLQSCIGLLVCHTGRPRGWALQHSHADLQSGSSLASMRLWLLLPSLITNNVLAISRMCLSFIHQRQRWQGKMTVHFWSQLIRVTQQWKMSFQRVMHHWKLLVWNVAFCPICAWCNISTLYSAPKQESKILICTLQKQSYFS